jgi:hypothetical protein
MSVLSNISTVPALAASLLLSDADFSSMDTLDADGKVLKSTLGRPAERDIVQAGARPTLRFLSPCSCLRFINGWSDIFAQRLLMRYQERLTENVHCLCLLHCFAYPLQFVPFNEYQNNGDLLAAQLLAELPGQFLEYVKVRGASDNLTPAKAWPATM